MATNKGLLLKQYGNLVKSIKNLSDGQAFLKVDSDSDTLEYVRFTIAPNDGPYRGGTFDFEIDLSQGDYPDSAPTVKCLTQVYHPNIDWCDEEGDVCLNLLDELWTADVTLEDIVQGLLFLFYNPNVEDPLSSMFTGGELEGEFLENVRRSLRGEEVDGVDFSRNLPDGYESDDENDDTSTSGSPTEIASEVQEILKFEQGVEATSLQLNNSGCGDEGAADKDLPSSPTMTDTASEVEPETLNTGIPESPLSTDSVSVPPVTGSNMDRSDSLPQDTPPSSEINPGSQNSTLHSECDHQSQESILPAGLTKLWTTLCSYTYEFKIATVRRFTHRQLQTQHFVAEQLDIR